MISPQGPGASGSRSPRVPADSVHPLVRVGAEWAWRLLLMFFGLLAVLYLVARLEAVIIPVAIAMLGAALMSPLVDWIQTRGVPRGLAVLIVIVGSLLLLVGILTFVVQQFISGIPELSRQATTSIDQAKTWLSTGPLHFSSDQISNAGDSIVKAIQSNQDALTSGALTTAATIGEIVTGALLALFTLIFLLYGGSQVWEFVTRIFPANSRSRIRLAGSLGFGSLVGYVRATVAVALVDAFGIGAGLAILSVPLALPLASLVFIGAFIPIIGAFVAGFVAVFIALVTKGWIIALIVLAVVVAVMQIESHVLQPFLLGRAVRIHPLAVVLSIAAGVVLAGIVGGLFAMPIVATLNTAIRSLLAPSPDEAIASTRETDDDTPMFDAIPDSPA